MIDAAIMACLTVFVSALYALAAISAARRFGIDLSLQRLRPAVVLLAGTSAEYVAVLLQSNIESAGMFMVAFGAVITGAACDAECGYVFDAVTLPCLGAMGVLALMTGSVPAFGFGAAASGGALLLLYALTRGKGLGLGDVKLACCIGGAAGAVGGLEALGVAFVLGGAYSSYLLLTKRASRGDELHFAPYLAAGMAIVVLHGVLA